MKTRPKDYLTRETLLCQLDWEIIAHTRAEKEKRWIERLKEAEQ